MTAYIQVGITKTSAYDLNPSHFQLSGTTLSVIGGTGVGDTVSPAVNTDAYVPQWDGANSKILKNGLAVGGTGLAYLGGIAGGQILKGGTASGENLTLNSTSHATKGKIYLGDDFSYNEALSTFGIGVAAQATAKIWLHGLDSEITYRLMCRSDITTDNKYHGTKSGIYVQAIVGDGYGDGDPTTRQRFNTFVSSINVTGEGSYQGFTTGGTIIGDPPGVGLTKEWGGLEVSGASDVTNTMITNEILMLRGNNTTGVGTGYPKVRGLMISMVKYDTDETTWFGWDTNAANSVGLWLWGGGGAFTTQRSYAGIAISEKFKYGIDLTHLVGDYGIDMTGATLSTASLKSNGFNVSPYGETTVTKQVSDTSSYGISVGGNFSGTTQAIGFLSVPVIYNTISNNLYGASFTPNYSAISGITQPAIFGLTAVPKIMSTASVNVTNIYGGFFRVDQLSTSGCVAANAYGLYVENPTATGVITNAYGLRINSITAGGTLNYSIYTGTAPSYLGGTLKVAGAFSCNNATPRTSAVIGAAAPAGGVGATEGAYDTAAHRDALITLVNNIRTALINNGIAVSA